MTKTQKAFFMAGVTVCAALAIGADLKLTGHSSVESTDDAYIMADYSTLAPNISGLIDQVFVEDHQQVRAGQEIAHIDDRDYKAAISSAEATLIAAKAAVANAASELARQSSVIAQAEATVRSDEAAVDFAETNATRYHNLLNGGGTAVEKQQEAAVTLLQANASRERDIAVLESTRHQIDTLEATRDQAAGNVQAAQADLEKARLNLSYTHILSPIDGIVGQRSVRVGNYVSAGTALLAVVPLQDAYVVANFRETQLAAVEPGQRVEVTVDSFPGQTLTGVIDSLAPASGATFSAIQPDNATGNFTKVVQRVPLRVRLDDGQPLRGRLKVGMSVIASVDTGSPEHRNTTKPSGEKS